MSFFTNLRADRLIAEIKGAEPASNREALEKLSRLGSSAIPRVIDALATADKQETAGFVNVLASLLDNRTFASIAAGLADGNQRTASGVAAALASSRNYPASML